MSRSYPARPLIVGGYNDPNADGNGARYHAQTSCMECGEIAGTAWSPYWCFKHNVLRMDRVSAQLDAFIADQPARRERARHNALFRSRPLPPPPEQKP